MIFFVKAARRLAENWRKVNDMKVVNPLNKAPLSPETMVNGGCHCVCTSGRNTSYAAAWLPLVPNCQCSCGGGTSNENANYQLAYDAAH